MEKSSKFVVDKKALSKHKTGVGKFLLLSLFYHKADLDINLGELLSGGLILEKRDENMQINGYLITQKGVDLIEAILLSSDPDSEEDPKIMELARKLKEMYPKGKKPGTPFYWADGVSLIYKRLRAFFKKYGKFPPEDIERATRRYMDGFQGDYTYMQLLKYFIFKNDIRSGELEESSQLLTFLENEKEQNQAEGTQGRII